jgi:hypothetical protein
MLARGLAAVLVASCVVAGGCFWDESSVFFIPDLWVGAEPPSKVWRRIRHPQLPVSFELPENYATPIDPQTLWLVKPEPLDAPNETVETWGIRPVTRGLVNHAIELMFVVITERDRFDPALVRQLSQPRPASEALLDFFRAALEPKRHRVLELSEPRPWALASCSAARLRVRWIPPSAYTHVHEILVAPVPGMGVLVADATVFERASDEERNVIAPRILDSVRVDPCASGSSRSRPGQRVDVYVAERGAAPSRSKSSAAAGE